MAESEPLASAPADERSHCDATVETGDTMDPEKVDEGDEIDEAAAEEAREKSRREREARAQALTLEIVGDLPFAEVKPPENVLFVCKLNPVTEDEDLHLIFSRFGKIVSCEVIRDKRTGDSLQYAFIEFENQKDCEQAYFKMQGVLIDDHRIHVDFSQSVSRLSDNWRSATNLKRSNQGGGFGGISHLEKRRQYRAKDANTEPLNGKSDGYGMVIDKKGQRDRSFERDRNHTHRRDSRSRSPRRQHRHRERTPPRRQERPDHRHRQDRDDYRPARHQERNRRH